MFKKIFVFFAILTVANAQIIKQPTNPDARHVFYENATSGLAADQVQDAIDEHVISTSNPHSVTWAQALTAGSTSGATSPIITAGQSLLFADTSFNLTLDTITLTAARAINFPNGSGTVALTSQSNGTIDHGADLVGLGDDDHNDATNGYILREASAAVTDNAISRWDGTGGRNLQNSGVIVADDDQITGVAGITIDNIDIDGNTIQSTSGALIINTPSLTTMQFQVDGSDEMRLVANSLKFESGSDDPGLGWSTDGMLDFTIGISTEMSLSANNLTFRAGVSDPILDWATSNQLSLTTGILLVELDAGTLPSIDAENGFIVKKTVGVGTEAGIAIVAAADGSSIINFGDTTNMNSGKIDYDHLTEDLNFVVGTREQLTINSGSAIFVNAGAVDPVMDWATSDLLKITTGVFQTDNAVNRKIDALSADTTLDATHFVVTVDATGASRTITLPALSGITGRVYHIKKIDVSANTVTVDGSGAETIDGATTAVISVQYDSIQIIAGASEWHII